jgi:hypothetical protein
MFHQAMPRPKQLNVQFPVDILVSHQWALATQINDPGLSY